MNKALKVIKRGTTFLALKVSIHNIPEVLEFIREDVSEFAVMFGRLIFKSKKDELLFFKIGNYILRDDCGILRSYDPEFIDSNFSKDGLVNFDYFDED